MTYRIKRGLFDLFYIFHPIDDRLAWSGSEWVLVREDGFPLGDAHVCNFGAAEEAQEYIVARLRSGATG